MSENSSEEDDILPVFAFRADNILKKQHEAYEEMLKKVQEEDTAKAVENEEKELLDKIQEKFKRNPTGRRKANNKAPPPKLEEKNLPVRRSTRRRKIPIYEDANEDEMPKIEEPPPFNLSARSKKKLKKMDLENQMERKRIAELNKRALASCSPSSVDDLNTSINNETEQDISLKISYLSEISKITVGENEKFSSIISKVADHFKLKSTEVALCLREEIIDFDDSPHSLDVKTWEIIDCIPYKPGEDLQDDEDSNKILLKMQSNDSKKKIDLYAHKLEKFQDIMERYANLRNLPLKNLIFEFDGEKIIASDTPEDLDMESGICVDVKVIGDSLKPVPPSIPYVDLEREEPQHKMLNICVLD